MRVSRPGLVGATAAAVAAGVVAVAVPRLPPLATGGAPAAAAAGVAYAPAPVPGGLAFRAISAGGYNGCGVTESGDAFCWGHDGSGQLGTGRFTAHMMRPERVRAGPWRTLAAGFYSTCGLAPDGTAFCWGSDSFGALGTGELHRGCGVASAAYAHGCVPAPAPVAGGLRFTAISTGGGNDRGTRQQHPSHHTCALTEAGEAWCWGSNHHGELGTGRQYPLENPAPVRVRTEERFTAVTTGFHHTCALARDGRAWCWGSGYAGELGTGDEGRAGEVAVAAAPRPVAGGLRFRQIDAGDRHTCAVTEAGEAYCWGADDRGQLGTGGAAGECRVVGAAVPCSPVPVPVAGGRRFRAVTLGESHTCALADSGEVFCWGEARTAGAGAGGGSLEACPLRPVGDLSDTDGCVPTPVRTDARVRFTAVDAGRTHTCALGTDRRAYCWGWGGLGPGLGIGTGTPVPAAVVEPGA